MERHFPRQVSSEEDLPPPVATPTPSGVTRRGGETLGCRCRVTGIDRKSLREEVRRFVRGEFADGEERGMAFPFVFRWSLKDDWFLWELSGLSV